MLKQPYKHERSSFSVWHVRELPLSAAVVVAILDDAPGLLWELEQVVDLRLHRRLILLIPAGEPEDLERKWRAFHQAIGRPCPPGLFQTTSAPERNLLAVVFNADLLPERIIAGERLAEYYRDAVELGAWYLRRGAERVAAFPAGSVRNLET